MRRRMVDTAASSDTGPWEELLVRVQNGVIWRPMGDPAAGSVMGGLRRRPI